MQKSFRKTALCLLVSFTLAFGCVPATSFASEPNATTAAEEQTAYSFPVEISGSSFAYQSQTITRTLSFDYAWLTTYCSTHYNAGLATFASLLSAEAYDGENIEKAPATGVEDKTRLLSDVGFTNVERVAVLANDEAVDANDKTDIIIGTRSLTVGGTHHTVYVVAIRGTNGTYEEWSSNFDVGSATADGYDKTGEHPEWDADMAEMHKGFAVTTSRVQTAVNNYMAAHPAAENDNVSILLTGHSRGAAIANILGKLYVDEGSMQVYDYTFSSPAVTTAENAHDSTYESIFNLFNADDLVSNLPLSQWGFTRYGTDLAYTFSSDDCADARAEYEAMTGHAYSFLSDVPTLLDNFAACAKDRDDLYSSSHDYDTATREFNLEPSAQAAVQTFNDAAAKLHCTELVNISYAYSEDSGKWVTTATICPAVVLNTLATVVGDSGDMTALFADLGAIFNVIPASTPYYQAISGVITSMVREGWAAVTFPHEVANNYSMTLALEDKATVHEWGEPVVVREPTHTETGLEQRTCLLCGAVQNRELACYPYAAPTGVQMDRSTATAVAGHSGPQLNAKVAPGPAAFPNDAPQDVTWNSADENVATVDAEGWVTGVNAGTVTITATTVNGLTATCQARVMREFPDVADQEAWYYAPVYEAAARGIMQGYGDGYFGSADNLTRAQLAVTLWRCIDPAAAAAYDAATKAKKDTTGMPDLGDGLFYTGACNWAVQQGYVKGYENGTFGPNDPVTCEQLCAILCRINNGAGDVTKLDSLVSDASDISAWARESCAWALENGAISGYKMDDGSRMLKPAESLWRVRAASILVNAQDNALLPMA
ncbi:MAG: S-layer homology domain-containing protein [Coriobacteriia bacterium]|nr:S-layer homology domain-containing protein [Coriobacteriia bacterium]